MWTDVAREFRRFRLAGTAHIATGTCRRTPDLRSGGQRPRPVDDLMAARGRQGALYV